MLTGALLHSLVILIAGTKISTQKTTMIRSQIIQLVHELKPTNFEITEVGGTVRYIEYKILAEGYQFTRRDVIDSLNYMVSREQIKEAGFFGSNKLYSYNPPQEN